MAAFEKAISVAPSPLIWNNIAYSLSEQNVQLERAETYADEAISALQVQLNDLNFNNLRTQDIAVTRLLFAVWDTKGWIAFQRGKVDEAEHYIQAAWLSGGSGDEAEHLGEIAEKRGKRDDAIRYYIFSLISENPSSEARPRLHGFGGQGRRQPHDGGPARSAKLRTLALSQSGKGTAEFFLLVSPSKVEQVTFIKGDDELKSFTETLQKTDLKMKFPPDTQVQAVRRGILHCGSTAPGPCTLELVPSAEVRSLE